MTSKGTSGLLQQPSGFLSLMPAWYTEQVSGKSSLGSEENYEKQRVGENVIE